MKKNFTLIIFLCLLITWKSKLNAQILPSSSKTALDGVIEPLNLPTDVWRVAVENETIENRVSTKNQLIMKEKTRIKLEKLKNNTLVSPPDNALKTLSPAKPILGHSYDGLPYSGMHPFDNGTAASNGKYILHSVNSSFAIYDSIGTKLFSNSLNTFFNISSSTTTLCDPRILYDAYSDRFIFMVIPTNACKLYIAFSKTNNPTGAWNKYVQSIPNEATTSLFDYPYALVNEYDLVVSGNVFGSNLSYLNNRVLQIRKKEGYAGGTLTVKDYKLTIDDESLCGAIQGFGGSPYGTKSYLISSIYTGNNKLKLYEISDTTGGSPTLTSSLISIPTYSLPADAVEKGSSTPLSVVDTRMFSAVFANGIIHCVFHSDGGGGFTAINYNRVDVSAKTTTTFVYKIPNSDVCFPSVALFSNSLANKSALIFYQEVNKNIYPSLSAVVCDDAGNWSLPVLIRNGTGPITGGGGSGNGDRWGDYTSATRKHNAAKPTVWVSGEYGKSGIARATAIAEITGDDVTGIKTNNLAINNKNIEIYPNPIVDRFYLSLDLEKFQKVTISLFNVEGKLVNVLYDGDMREGENIFSFDKTSLNQGIYFLKVTTESGLQKSEKIVISQ